MAAPYSNLASKAESALKLAVEAVSLANRGNAAVYTGLGVQTDLPVPRIEVTADQGEEEPPNTGNFYLSCNAKVYSSADIANALTAHGSRSAYVFDALMMDNLADTLSATAVTDFTCIGVRNRRPQPQRMEGRNLVSELAFDLYCASSDL